MLKSRSFTSRNRISTFGPGCIEHVDAAGFRGNAQYGHVLGKRMAMMGSGTLFTEHEARPWLGRVRRHTGALFGWTPIHRIRFNHASDLLTDRQRQLASVGHP